MTNTSQRLDTRLHVATVVDVIGCGCHCKLLLYFTPTNFQFIRDAHLESFPSSFLLLLFPDNITPTNTQKNRNHLCFSWPEVFQPTWNCHIVNEVLFISLRASSLAGVRGEVVKKGNDWAFVRDTKSGRNNGVIT